MDTLLNAQAKLDIATEVVRIEVRGSLTQQSRPTLMQLISHVRRMGITSHIRVNLGHAAFVESSALAGLRIDLNAIDGAAALVDTAGALPSSAGISLELHPDVEHAAALPSLDLSADLTASMDTDGTRALTAYSDDELLAASDSVFGLLDNPADMANTRLLATYVEIGLELSRRELDIKAVPRQGGLRLTLPDAGREPEPV